MSLLRIREVRPGDSFRLHLVLTDGRHVERDVVDLLKGPIFDAVRREPKVFHQIKVEAGTVCWPNGADLCPDTLIWGGSPPESPADPPTDLSPWATRAGDPATA